MNVVLPLWAEDSPAVLHMGQFGRAEGQEAGSCARGEATCWCKLPALCRSLVQRAETKSSRGVSASTRLLPGHRSHLDGTRGWERKCYVFLGGKKKKKNGVAGVKAQISLLSQEDRYWVLMDRVGGGHARGPDLRNVFETWCNDKAWHYGSLRNSLASQACR